MKKPIAIFLLLLIVTGCAHKELKAPCANIASLTSDAIPCDQRQSINTPIVPSVFSN